MTAGCGGNGSKRVEKVSPAGDTGASPKQGLEFLGKEGKREFQQNQLGKNSEGR